MINFGTQYYRPPFPVNKYWLDDLKKMKDSGLNCVQLWVLWSWVESRPGTFDYADYDRLVEMAGKAGLNVVLSLIAEVQPPWIHREAPGSEMINHLGHKIVSENRTECHYGITPGGCFDHPEVWRRMSDFLSHTVTRYKDIANLAGWDVWNELRWNVQAEGRVCYCPHTIQRFRGWLEEKYGSLDELNRAWIRRYSCWEDVLPGKNPDNPFTEWMAFTDFICRRSNQHGLDRYRLVKEIDPVHLATVHGPQPCHLLYGGPSLNRGNDWFYADEMDGIGCSNFPALQKLNNTDYSVHMESIRSAARDKKFWISELQGGRSNFGFELHSHVEPAPQQRWVWNGIAAGADTIIFWCWRNEVFGRESAGFGITGDDGFAEARLKFIKQTGDLFAKHEKLLKDWKAAPAETGILFSPQTYYLYDAQEGNSYKPMIAINGWGKAMIEKSIPFELIEEEHLDQLNHLKFLILPGVCSLDDHTAARLMTFVENGGTLLCEGECGLWDTKGLMRYPEERFVARLTGCSEAGRRSLPEDGNIELQYGGKSFHLQGSHWLTPWLANGKNVTCHTEYPNGTLLMSVPYGKGKLLLCGAFLGGAYEKQRNPDFEELLTLWLKDADVCMPPFQFERGIGSGFGASMYIKYGRSGDLPMAFIFFPPEQDNAEISFAPKFWTDKEHRDLLTGQSVVITADTEGNQVLRLTAGEWRMAIIV